MAYWKRLPVREVSIKGFRGLYESLPATERPLGLLSSVSNLILSPSPSLSTVPGTTAMGSALAAVVARGVMQYKNLAGTTTQTLAQAGCVLKRWDGSTWQTIDAGTVASVTITAGGSGYTSAPAVAFAGSGTGAAGTAVLTGNAVTSVTITNAGTGYLTTATVSFSGGAGTGAAGTVVMTVPDAKMEAANLNDLGCLFWPGYAPKSWNGSALAALGGSPPQAGFACAAYEQLFVSGIPGREGDIDYCDDAAPETWTAAATNNAGSITASVNPVKWLGFDKTQGKVLFWTTQEIGVINGPETPNKSSLWAVRSLALYGTPNGRTVQNVNGTWVWLTNSGNRVGFAMWSGGSIDIVYLPISTSLGYITWSDIANACSWIDESGRYHCQTPSGVGDTFTKLTNPTSLPAGIANASAFSPDGTYLAVPHSTSPYITIYKRDEDVFTKLSDPATLPTGTGYGASWSPDGDYLAVCHDTSPYLTIYSRSGDVFTKLSNPATLPTGFGIGVSFSPDGGYLAVGHSTTPYVTIYSKSGATFTKLSNPSTLPTGNGQQVAWSPDSAYLVVSHETSPFITIYSRSGDVFTKLSDPATLPPSFGNMISFSPDGVYLAVPHPYSPYITIYSRSGDVFTKLSDPATLPTGAGAGSAWSTDGTYLAVSHNTSPSITIYSRSGDVFTKLSDPATLPVGNGRYVAFSPDGTYLSVSHVSSPFVTIYKSSGYREFIYDPVTNGWFTGKSLDVRAGGVISVSGRDVSIIGSSVGVFYKTKGTTNGGTDFDWSVVIGPSTLEADFRDKQILEAVVLMSAEATATVYASFSTTESGSYTTIKTLTIGTGITKQRFPVPIRSGDANKSNVFRLKLNGTGVVTIHDIQLRIYTSGT